MTDDNGSQTTPRSVLVTGASTFLGGYLVARLAANPDIERVVAVDSRVPTKDLMRRMGRAEFLRLDIRRPAIAKAISNYEVDTVVHAAPSIMDSVEHSAAIKELDVVGTMQVCAACQRSPSVKRLVLRSSAMVYGAGPSDPVAFTEGTPARKEPRRGYGRDLIDMEGYARGLSRRRQDIGVSILRFQSILGPRIRTRMSSYLSMPLVPTAFGYQPRLQFLHEEDALAALEHATLNPRPGTFNVAGEGIVTLSQSVHRAGHLKLPVPQPLISPLVSVLQNGRLPGIRSDNTPYLSYGRVLDTTRMRTELGFAPKYSSIETLDDFVARGRTGPVISSETWRGLEQRAVAAATRLQ
ncbi:NAD-dependent epimerase/dehydratase family protein [Gordonia sp. (in: high G+C Gram-positive bacteria)]|uniref:NAD-dependent epimerase/dehydratase family protein n=1 Tax=Gordonia sp. (in: high G+C Gram-positive bacteria) TaxID=84139 RepID=UPI0016924B9F|nr:NAD-dependent epimerase/dehydratase family protein [Gordonia sp. (in: high G+C Gram-positive bacteria)]NLG45548.1 NAD-dependent epimerase/dehydratase family protein [Gordonia sp. (in: high G+C Gram-positive bacteria)]